MTAEEVITLQALVMLVLLYQPGSKYINVFEFNIHNSHSFGYRQIAVNGRFIRGFVVPKSSIIRLDTRWQRYWFKKKDGMI